MAGTTHNTVLATPKMTDISEIITATAHRPFELPLGKWRYYQEWNDALFLHWTIPYEILRDQVPQKLNLDNFNGDFYVSLVAFTMQKIRPKNLPAIKYVSDFDEINIRTYIDNDEKKGVYFLNIEAGKILSTFIAKNLSGLPYERLILIEQETNASRQIKISPTTLTPNLKSAKS